MKFLNKLWRLGCKKVRLTREGVGIRGAAVAVLRNVRTGEMRVIRGHNIVTNNGDKYYAQNEYGTPDSDFTAGGCKLGTGLTAPTKADTDIETYITGSFKAVKAGYPICNDTDAANTGAGVDVVTWCYYWEAAEAVADGISECAICLDAIAPPTDILNHALFDAPFNKTDAECLTVFINHTFNGT